MRNKNFYNTKGHAAFTVAMYGKQQTRIIKPLNRIMKKLGSAPFSVSAVNHILRGRRLPTLPQAIAIEDELGISHRLWFEDA